MPTCAAGLSSSNNTVRHASTVKSSGKIQSFIRKLGRSTQKGESPVSLGFPPPPPKLGKGRAGEECDVM